MAHCHHASSGKGSSTARRRSAQPPLSPGAAARRAHEPELPAAAVVHARQAAVRRRPALSLSAGLRPRAPAARAGSSAAGPALPRAYAQRKMRQAGARGRRVTAPNRSGQPIGTKARQRRRSPRSRPFRHGGNYRATLAPDSCGSGETARQAGPASSGASHGIELWSRPKRKVV